MSPKFVDKNKKKKDIALISLSFFSHGYKEASISEIAKKAGIGKGTVYEYFKNKEELFSFALTSFMEVLADNLKKFIADIDSPVDKLYGLIELTMTDFGPDNMEVTGLFMTLFQQTFNPSGVFYKKKDFVYTLSQNIVAILSEIIIEGVDKGYFTKDAGKNAPIISRNILAYMDGISIHSMTADKSFNIKKHMDFFLKTLFSSIKKK